MNKMDWSGIVDGIQVGLLVFSLTILTLSLGALILFDVLAGTGVMLELTQGDLLVSAIISFATTGLVLALLTAGYQVSGRKGGSKMGWVILLLGAGVYSLDIYFDSLGADILRYGRFVSGQEVDQIHLLYRILIGGVSVVGEPLSIAMILGMDAIKKMLESALPDRMMKTVSSVPVRTQRPAQNPPNFPSNLPRQA